MRISDFSGARAFLSASGHSRRTSEKSEMRTRNSGVYFPLVGASLGGNLLNCATAVFEVLRNGGLYDAYPFLKFSPLITPVFFPAGIHELAERITNFNQGNMKCFPLGKELQSRVFCY